MELLQKYIIRIGFIQYVQCTKTCIIKWMKTTDDRRAENGLCQLNGKISNIKKSSDTSFKLSCSTVCIPLCCVASIMQLWWEDVTPQHWKGTLDLSQFKYWHLNRVFKHFWPVDLFNPTTGRASYRYMYDNAGPLNCARIETAHNKVHNH